ncbi:MAG: bifunctional 3,4-dihydroxy-2-butanone-4-phosphate synthase/GTP cyclohydrolase II, partial [Pollutimonas bauzanensis]
GTMARLPDLKIFAREHGLKIGTIADLIQYRSEHESMIERLASRSMKTPWGEFLAVAYRDLSSGAPHMALVHGDITPDTETLVRVHEPTNMLDVLFEGATTHSWSVSDALKAIAAAPCGILVMLNCQGSSDLLFSQFESWNQAASPDTHAVDRESRYGLLTYGIGAQIMRDLNVGRARLLARPRKMPSMTGFSLTITGYDSDPLSTP